MLVKRDMQRGEDRPAACRVVVPTFLLLTFASGLTFYAWPVYFDELVAHGFSLGEAPRSMAAE